MAVVLAGLLRAAHQEFLWREGLQRLLSTLVATRKPIVLWVTLRNIPHKVKL